MMACFRGNREEFYGEVLLLDDRKMTLTAEQSIKKSSKAAAILQLVLSYLDVAEVEFFGLRFCDDKQQTVWLDPSKTLSQHRGLFGPPYIFYFGVKFYVEDPSRLKDETTRHQFYLQVRQDVCQGRLPCPARLRPRLWALMLQADRGDHTQDGLSDSKEQQEVQLLYESLAGVCRPEAQRLFLSLCSSLQMYGVSLFAAYGENQTEYFLGPTPAGVVVYKNKVMVGRYFWQRITKLHFKDETFELRVSCRNGSETSFFFQMLDRWSCKRLWRCCVEHHAFFRMSEMNPIAHKLKRSSIDRSPALPGTLTDAAVTKTDVCPRQRSTQTASISSGLMIKQTAPPAVHRSEGVAGRDHKQPGAPWENGSTVSGLFNPKFPPNTKEEKHGGGPQRRSRSLDGDRPIRQHRRSSRFRGNMSSGSESERMASSSEHRRCRTKRRPSPDAHIWKHIQKQLVEPDHVIHRQMEEIPYKEVRVLGEPIRVRRSPRGRRHQRCVSASDLQSKPELLPPLPVTTTTDTFCRLPTSP
ncbi:band 4.1-like protein 4 isoform X2 [Parambassis ranga]|nr:band 4.1-like protein 4A isoform X2 [Parambassis ranga]XP_028274413.1 band 4.1-like protein 4A isoform X2 [Parambassis ranga]